MHLTVSNLFNKRLKDIFYFVPTVEWMGYVFYDIRGDINKDLEIDIIDFIPLSKGHLTSVGINMKDKESEKIFHKYLIEKYPGKSYGLIHRHPDKVFISGVDRKEIDSKLKDNEYSNGYLSVVVNSFGDILASFNILGTIKREIEEVITIKGKSTYRKYNNIIKNVFTEEKKINIIHSFNIDNELLTEVKHLQKWKETPVLRGSNGLMELIDMHPEL